MLTHICRAAIVLLALGAFGSAFADPLPTGQTITPMAAPGTIFQRLNPHLKDFPAYTADHGASLALSPDGKTLLALTSGFNRVAGPDGKMIPAASGEYIFIYDLSGHKPRQKQVIQIPNSFGGIAFAPDGNRFYVGGGGEDAVHRFQRAGDSWAEAGPAIKLGHKTALGLSAEVKLSSSTAGIAVTADGATVIAADLANDAISLIDVKSGRVTDLDLRPGGGKPGGTYPYWIAVKGNGTVFVSSLRDREIVVVDLGLRPHVAGRIPVPGNPGKMVLNRAQTRLFVANDNSDSVSVIDTATNGVTAEIKTTAPASLLAGSYRGASPNALALSADETRLFVTNGGANSVAIIALDQPGMPVTALIPTGWGPSAIVAAEGWLHILNGKSVPGPNPKWCNSTTPDKAKISRCRATNQYILELEKAALQSLPIPRPADQEELTRQVSANNRYQAKPDPRDMAVMAELHRRIRHVIYIVKENRTYDQVLGDLGKGNGDPAITEFGAGVTPNQHRLAQDFVALDNFYDSGEVSGNGWPWSTAARESNFGATQIVSGYAQRGHSYDVEGTNRDVNVSLGSLAERLKANPLTPNDPDILPGTNDVDALDSPSGDKQQGYLWDAALRARLSVRNYGFFCDLARYSESGAGAVPLDPAPFKSHLTVAFPANAALAKVTDPYFRSFDNRYPDLYREQEWEREFDQAAASGTLPALSLVRLMHDHMGAFATAIDGVNTPEAQMADNDYAVGRLIAKVAASPFRSSTLIFILEDDAQAGPDHMDAHRSIAFIAGPYVRHGAVVSRRYTTVNMLRTIEDVLGIDHLSLNDATQRPMTEAFDLTQADWGFEAKPAAVLKATGLPLAEKVGAVAPTPSHPASWWAARTEGMDFSVEDKIDPVAFNRVLWTGLMGAKPYPSERSGKDFSGASY